MSIVVIALITPKPDRFAELRDAFAAVIPQIQDEPGCEFYALHEAEGKLATVEKWASQADLETHMAAPALTSMRPLIETALAAPLDITSYTPVHVDGDPAKSAV